MTHTYNITGMTCGSCVARVKNELLKLGHVLQADVQLQSPQAVVTMGKHIGTDQLQQAVAKAGPYTLTEADSRQAMPAAAKEDTRPSYYPIFLLFGYILLSALLGEWVAGYFDITRWAMHFMAGFFLVFSFFKLLDIRGFSQGYGSYDIVARVFPAWGFIYPFVELLLGILLFTGLFPLGTNIAAFLVMGVSAIGVIKSLLSKSVFQCACLGTVIKLPLSKLTLFEDLLMVMMSAVMIVRELRMMI